MKKREIVPDTEILKTPPQYSIQFELNNEAKRASLRSRSLDIGRYLRLIKDENGNVMYFFVADSTTGKSFFTLPFQMFSTLQITLIPIQKTECSCLALLEQLTKLNSHFFKKFISLMVEKN